MRSLLRTITVVSLLLLTLPSFCQRFHVGTNAADLAMLGTLNLEAGAAVAQNWSLHAGAELNPWTWRAGDRQTQFQNRQMSFWGGLRWWPWHVYSGWWVGADGRYTVYNLGGVFSRDTQEGKAYGGGLYGGYSFMLSSHWNLDVGGGAFGGWTRYTAYSCPLCGVITDEGGKVFILPDARVAIQFIF